METIEHAGWAGRLGQGLTPQQLRCVIETRLGKRDKETARALGLSPGTVKRYMFRALEQMDCRHRTEMIGKACELKIIWRVMMLFLAICCIAVQATPDHQPVTRNRIVRVKGGARRDADVSVLRIC
tara:strand:- start:403 stop:780 length:378 start_codon:yes stop_codon:yes gene_type:complete